MKLLALLSIALFAPGAVAGSPDVPDTTGLDLRIDASEILVGAREERKWGIEVPVHRVAGPKAALWVATTALVDGRMVGVDNRSVPRPAAGEEFNYTVDIVFDAPRQGSYALRVLVFTHEVNESNRRNNEAKLSFVVPRSTPAPGPLAEMAAVAVCAIAASAAAAGARGRR